MKGQLVITEGLPESSNKLAAKNATEHVNGKKTGRVIYPVGVIERQPHRQEQHNGDEG